MSDLPSGQEDDRWHQLMLSNSKTPRGSVRFGALFKDYMILPKQEYEPLKEVCQQKTAVVLARQPSLIRTLYLVLRVV